MKNLGDTENKIIAAATRVFLERGMDGARMQEIADLAGINKALLHYYFRSKEKLFGIVAEQKIKGVFSQLFRIPPLDISFSGWLRQFIHTYMDIIAQNPQLTGFILWEIQRGGKQIANILKEELSNPEIKENPLFCLINRAIAAKEIRAVDATQLIISIIALCVYPYIAKPILQQLFPGLDVISVEFRNIREEAVYDLILRGVEQK